MGSFEKKQINVFGQCKQTAHALQTEGKTEPWLKQFKIWHMRNFCSEIISLHVKSHYDYIDACPEEYTRSQCL
mgnify:CR=1 FL=1